MAISPVVLIVAGTDPTGGAGIVRDIETTAHFKVKANLAVTSVNVQDDQHVATTCPMSADLVQNQMMTALNNNSIYAIKIGMTGDKDIVEAITETVKQFSNIPTVLDPVLSASSGGALAKKQTTETIITQLLPHIDLLTPNMTELAILSKSSLANTHEQAIQQAKKLLSFGAKNILVKGGHAGGTLSIDSLVSQCNIEHFESLRLNATMRGTGCTLSSAIAANLALGKPLSQAIQTAKDYVYTLISKNVSK